MQGLILFKGADHTAWVLGRVSNYRILFLLRHLETIWKSANCKYISRCKYIESEMPETLNSHNSNVRGGIKQHVDYELHTLAKM